MKPLPALSRLTLRVLNEEAQVQAILLSSLRNIESLTFDHSSLAEIFQNLDYSLAANHLWALVYELPGNESSSLLFHKLEGIVKTDDGGYQIAIFHEPASNYCNFYLLAHKDHERSFGSYFKGAKLAIFQYSYQDLFGSSCDNYMKYLTSFSLSISSSASTLKAVTLESISVKASIEDLDSAITKCYKKNSRLQQKIVTAKKIIRKLHSQLTAKSPENNVDCVKCKNTNKGILFSQPSDQGCDVNGNSVERAKF